MMDAPFQDLTPTLARSRISPLVPQLSPLPGTPGTPGTPSTPVARPARSGKARDLLRQHYGMSVGPPAPLPGRPHDPMNIDSASFDAKAYYEQLITTTTLTGLLKRENELSAEIRQLDGERQSLVYNHHHELIAASDTIRAMKSRAESLDADLDKLKVAFSEISRLASEVSVADHLTKEDSDQPTTPQSAQ